MTAAASVRASASGSKRMYSDTRFTRRPLDPAFVGRLRERFGAGGPYLFGDWSVPDAFFTPVAARIRSIRPPTSSSLRPE